MSAGPTDVLVSAVGVDATHVKPCKLLRIRHHLRSVSMVGNNIAPLRLMDVLVHSRLWTGTKPPPPRRLGLRDWEWGAFS